jgi:hypothetical protein
MFTITLKVNNYDSSQSDYVISSEGCKKKK